MSAKLKRRAAIFVSGSGTNMENLAKRAQRGELDCEIRLVVCDRPEAFALKRAEALGLKAAVFGRKTFKSKADFEQAIARKLKKNEVEVIFLAGFMRILSPDFVRAWQGRILNIHPSLLPKFPGAHAIQDAFEAREKETGVTIHFVDEGVDSGPIILQRSVPIKAGDTLEALEARVHAVEHELYPEAIRLFLNGKIKQVG